MKRFSKERAFFRWAIRIICSRLIRKRSLAMPKCKVDLTAENKACLKTLREAADVGIADIEQGRFQTFDAPESLSGHLSQLAEGAIAGPAAEM